MYLWVNFLLFLLYLKDWLFCNYQIVSSLDLLILLTLLRRLTLFIAKISAQQVLKHCTRAHQDYEVWCVDKAVRRCLHTRIANKNSITGTLIAENITRRLLSGQVEILREACIIRLPELWLHLIVRHSLI